MKGHSSFFQLVCLSILALPMLAEAHPMHRHSESSIDFLSGFSHPLTSLDHIISMLLIGFWIAQSRRRDYFLMPLILVMLMLMGCLLSIIPVDIGRAEDVMHLSAILIGLIMISRYKISSLIAVLGVGNFALFHGYLHAYEIWLKVDAGFYTVGFALATIALITEGMALNKLIVGLMSKTLSLYKRKM